MIEPLSPRDWGVLALAFIAGGIVAALYLMALWHAVRRLARTPRPGTALLAGGLLRVALVAGALAAAAPFGFGPLLAALAGFAGVRLVVTRRVRAAGLDGGG